MEVRPERTSHAAALEARASVVSIPCDDATERFRPEVEHVRPAWFSNPAIVFPAASGSVLARRTSPIIRVSPARVS